MSGKRFYLTRTLTNNYGETIMANGKATFNGSKNGVNPQQCNNKRQAMAQLKRVKWDLRYRSENQKKFYETIENNDVTFSVGPAGCGKTFLATYYALKMFSRKTYKNIIVTKPLVEVDGEKLGYLPGNIDEKTEPYMMSIYYNMEQIIGKRRLEILRQSGDISVIPLAYMRGLTINDSVVILDEAQNASIGQIKTFVTRLGMRSKFIICGDIEQSDIKGLNGLKDSLKRFPGIAGVDFSDFNLNDVVRHPIVAEMLKRYEKN